MLAKSCGLIVCLLVNTNLVEAQPCAKLETRPATTPTGKFVFDEQRQQMVCFDASQRTWVDSGEFWFEKQTSGVTPPALTALAYDYASGRVVGFANSSPGTSVEFWSWDGTAWSKHSGVTPPNRTDAIFVGDPIRKIVLLAGGRSNTDTWVWNGTSWSQANGPGAVLTQHGAGACFDYELGRILVAGGYLGPDPRSSPTDAQVSWDGTSWNAVAVTGGAPKGAFVKLLSVPGLDVTYALAGYDPGCSCNPAILYRRFAGSWSVLSPTRYQYCFAESIFPSSLFGLIYDPRRSSAVSYAGDSVSVFVPSFGNAPQFVLDSQPTDSVGEGGTWSVNTTGESIEGVSLQWYRNGVPVSGDVRYLFGSSGPCFVINGVQTQDAGVYELKISSSCGVQTLGPFRLNTPCGQSKPVINRQSEGQSAPAGSTITLFVEASSGTPMQYQWRRDGTPLANSPQVSGANSAVLTVRNSGSSDSGSYTCRINNECDYTDSNVIPMTIFCPADANRDGFLDFTDFDQFVLQFELGC